MLMPFSNTTTRYGEVTKTFHWLTAILIVVLIPLGIMASNAAHAPEPDFERAAFLFSLHKTLGVTLFFVALLRILWALRQTKPGPLHAERKAETLVAEIVHWTLYSSLMLVPLAGWISHAAAPGFAPIWWAFGQTLPFVPQTEATKALFGSLHIVFERVLIISIILHVAGAMKHVVIDKDSTLSRMWFGNSDAPPVPLHYSSILPPIAAAAIFGAAVVIGNVVGVFDRKPSPVPAVAALEEVASEWQVTDGTLAISITQFGNTVEGVFTDWTAQIAFDETQGPNNGQATVTINIGSLELGAVRDQAMGPDFFDVETHPTAVFDGEIMTGVDGTYDLIGTLTIKGVSTPTNLPFALQIDGDTAQMQGNLTLDRLAFGIGETMGDEGSLAFAVEVDVTLAAVRGQ
jgi:cytochrome b561/polyisoprenoid-binding protein YceI